MHHRTVPHAKAGPLFPFHPGPVVHMQHRAPLRSRLPPVLVAVRACSWPRVPCCAGQFPSTSCIAPCTIQGHCLPCLPALHRAVQVINLEVPGPVRTLDKNGLNLTFASKFPKATLSKTPNHPRQSSIRPLHTPAPGFLELDPHQIAITRLLACIVTFTNVLVLPRHVRRQNATTVAYPMPGNLIRHSG